MQLIVYLKCHKTEILSWLTSKEMLSVEIQMETLTLNKVIRYQLHSHILYANHVQKEIVRIMKIWVLIKSMIEIKNEPNESIQMLIHSTKQEATKMIPSKVEDLQDKNKHLILILIKLFLLQICNQSKFWIKKFLNSTNLCTLCLTLQLEEIRRSNLESLQGKLFLD